MARFPGTQARIVLLLLIVAAPVTATLALERAAREPRPPAFELRKSDGLSGGFSTPSERPLSTSQSDGTK